MSSVLHLLKEECITSILRPFGTHIVGDSMDQIQLQINRFKKHFEKIYRLPQPIICRHFLLFGRNDEIIG